MSEPLTGDLLNALEAFFRFRTKGDTITFATRGTHVELDKSLMDQSIVDLRKKLQTGNLCASDTLFLRLLYDLSGLYYFENRWMMWGGIPLPSIEERP